MHPVETYLKFRNFTESVSNDSEFNSAVMRAFNSCLGNEYLGTKEKADGFAQFVEAITTDDDMITVLVEGATVCLEAHNGIIRAIDDGVEKNSLAASGWDATLKKEIYTDIDHTLTGRKSMGTTGSDIGAMGKLGILDTSFTGPSVTNLSLADLSEQTAGNMRERIGYLLVDPTQKIHKISNVPNDIQRYYRQYQAVKQTGSVEPVIFIKNNGKLDLFEGNHRLMAVIKIAAEDMIENIMNDPDQLEAIIKHKVDVKNLTPDEIPSLRAIIFKHIPDTDVKFSIPAYVGTPPKDKGKISIIIDMLKKEFSRLFA